MSNKSKIKKSQKFSTYGFIFSTIGAAVGLGNIWRFPREVVSNGGSSFIFIYLIVLALIALPIVFLEMQYGLFFRRSPVSCFGQATSQRRSRFWGWTQIFVVLFLTFYYLIVTAWVLTTLVNSFIPTQYNKLIKEKSSGSSFFANNIVTGKEGNPSWIPSQFTTGVFADFAIWTFFAAVILIVLILLIFGFGQIKVLEKVNLVIVPALFIMLIGLVAYSLTQSDSDIVVKKLFKFDPATWQKPDVWVAALRQAVFSTGIFFGIFIVFSASSDARVDKGNDAILIVAADTLVGILAGFLIVSIVATEHDTEAKLNKFFEDENKSASTGLSFIYLPKIFANIKTPFLTIFSHKITLGQVLNIIFFLSLFFAAFSSLIALVSIPISSIAQEFAISRKKVLFGILFLILGMSAIYSSKYGGGGLVGIQDKILVTSAMFVGIFQILFFTASSKFKKILKTNEIHSYVKLSFWGIYKTILWILVLPVIIFATFHYLIDNLLAVFWKIKLTFDFTSIKKIIKIKINFDPQDVIKKSAEKEQLITNLIGVALFVIMMVIVVIIFFIDRQRQKFLLKNSLKKEKLTAKVGSEN